MGPGGTPKPLRIQGKSLSVIAYEVAWNNAELWCSSTKSWSGDKRVLRCWGKSQKSS